MYKVGDRFKNKFSGDKWVITHDRDYDNVNHPRFIIECIEDNGKVRKGTRQGAGVSFLNKDWVKIE